MRILLSIYGAALLWTAIYTARAARIFFKAK